MKVLVVLGIYSLIAVSGGSILPEGRENHCCNLGKQEDTCVSFGEIVARETQQIEMADLTEKTPTELLLKSKIDAFSNAALECIPRHQVYRYVHVMMDDLNTIIDNFPTPKNVLKRITEAEDLMEERFDSLQAAQDDAGSKLSPELRSRIDEFVEESIDRAVKVFDYNLQKAKANVRVLSDVQINELIDKLVDKLNSCLAIRPSDFDSNFKCRQNVRTLGCELRDKIRDLRIMGKVRVTTPDQSIDRLISNFTAEEKALEDLIMNDKLQREFLREYKGFLP